VPLSWKQHSFLVRTGVPGNWYPHRDPTTGLVVCNRLPMRRLVRVKRDFLSVHGLHLSGAASAGIPPSALWVSDSVAGWLNSARMAEISHPCVYNFSRWHEFN
jgi:hypothetical protein